VQYFRDLDLRLRQVRLMFITPGGEFASPNTLQLGEPSLAVAVDIELNWPVPDRYPSPNERMRAWHGF
jgi:hypothetical protein